MRGLSAVPVWVESGSVSVLLLRSVLWLPPLSSVAIVLCMFWYLHNKRQPGIWEPFKSVHFCLMSHHIYYFMFSIPFPDTRCHPDSTLVYLTAQAQTIECYLTFLFKLVVWLQFVLDIDSFSYTIFPLLICTLLYFYYKYFRYIWLMYLQNKDLTQKNTFTSVKNVYKLCL